MRPRGIHQLSVSAAYGDAIGNEVLEIRDALREAGYESDIFVELIDPRMASHVRPFREYREVSSPDNLILLHYSLGSKVSAMARDLPDPMVLVYHNVTPAEWFAPYNFGLARDCAMGRVELSGLRERTALGLGDSEYNRRELEELGFEPTGVLPLILDLDRFEGPADPIVLERFGDERTTFLFVGRVVPNKSFEDLLRAFAYYQRWIDHRAHLVIVGEFRTFAPYHDALQEMAGELGLDEVHFTGHVTQEELNAFYRVADAFVCMSEHEGFCVPLFEAMRRRIPVLAHDAAAIPFSTGEGVLMVRDKDPALVAEAMALLVRDEDLRNRLLARQDRVLEGLRRDRVVKTLMDHLRSIGIE